MTHANLFLQVPAFRATKFKVTNGEFAAFVRGGGYSNKKWWSEEGWSWRTFRNIKWPTFWVLGESKDWSARWSCTASWVLGVPSGYMLW